MPAAAEPFAPLLAALRGCPPVARLLAAGGKRASVGGLWGSSAAAVVGLRAQGSGAKLLALSPSADMAESLLLDLGLLFPTLPTVWFPVEESEVAGGSEVASNHSERLLALDALRLPGDGVVVVPAPVLLEECPVPDESGLSIVRGERLDRDAALTALAAAGFRRVALVSAPGEVSLRGGLLDVYPWAARGPVRLEFLDDVVEDLRSFEVDTQRSVASLERVRLRLGSGAATRARLDQLLPADLAVLILDPPRGKDRLAEVAFEKGLPPRRIEQALAALRRHPGGELHPLDTGLPRDDLSLRSVSGALLPMEEHLTGWRDEGRAVLLLCDGEGESQRLSRSLEERGLQGPWLSLLAGRLTGGFAFPAPGPVLAHHHELLGARAVRRQRRKLVATRALESLAELHPGDWVVHLLHGVARYRGMQRLAREQGEEDFLVLEFAGDTTLYVPASRIDLVERFVGSDGAGPKLDKIGGKTWARKKARVAGAVQDLAAELLALAATRAAGGGFAHPSADPLLPRFVATFPYEDTPDQHQAWEEVAADMARPRPMDRLLVGDVGFGKTEVAVRAAYLSVLGGKQVAVLVPTTILAEQHFETFRHRMAEEPLRVEALSRLRSGSAATLRDLAEGRIDVVIGTHALLGSEVRFADLGLLVVDEEQRFGVEHKERLKHLRSSVDVLSLSATPIPRTLHMALSGLRDISTIRTPPPGRRAVVTRVTYDDDRTIRAALRHELDRGGQVFVLHNRVQSIAAMLERVRHLVPTARSQLAHGQMPPHQLAEVVSRFTAGEIDVLVCTTIIESGIDIPRANTIVVLDSHRFGLADMHQLRGRVGRENRQAYAFFLVPPGEVSEAAERRLKALEEFSSLDAGLPIALRDLELRGAGNLLGAEQSGHILAVGYDMYCRLLRRAVASAQGKPPEPEPGEVEVEIGLVAYLPTLYVQDEAVRLGILRRLAAAGRRGLDALANELVDRFGPLPAPAAALLDLFRLRRLVRLAGLSSLQSDGSGAMLLAVRDGRAFTERGPFRPDELYPFTPTRIRVPWPDEVETPAERLRYLLERFSASRPAGAAR